MLAHELKEPVDQLQPRELQQNFDYTILDPETRKTIKQRTREIRSLMRQTIQGCIEIGKRLIEVKQKLEHGQFGKWIKAEFGWDSTRVSQYMHVAKSEVLLKFSQYENLSDLSTIFLIADPKTPEEARKEILERVQKRKTTTNQQARFIVDRYKKVTARFIVNIKCQEARQEMSALIQKEGKLTKEKARSILAKHENAANYKAEPVTNETNNNSKQDENDVESFQGQEIGAYHKLKEESPSANKMDLAGKKLDETADAAIAKIAVSIKNLIPEQLARVIIMVVNSGLRKDQLLAIIAASQQALNTRQQFGK